MKLTKVALLTVACFLVAACSARAQVDRVVVEADGMSKTCNSGLETALQSMDSVYKYAISIDKQMFSVIYYSGEKFDPQKLRWAARKGEADVVRFHVSATGKVEQDGDHQIFVAGKDRFLLDGIAPLPTDVSLGIMGVADDSTETLELTPDDVQRIDPDASEPSEEAPPSPPPAEPPAKQAASVQ